MRWPGFFRGKRLAGSHEVVHRPVEVVRHPGGARLGDPRQVRQPSSGPSQGQGVAPAVLDAVGGSLRCPGRGDDLHAAAARPALVSLARGARRPSGPSVRPQRACSGPCVPRKRTSPSRPPLAGPPRTGPWAPRRSRGRRRWRTCRPFARARGPPGHNSEHGGDLGAWPSTRGSAKGEGRAIRLSAACRAWGTSPGGGGEPRGGRELERR